MDTLVDDFFSFMALNVGTPSYSAIRIETLIAKVRYTTPIRLKYGRESYRQMPSVIIANVCKNCTNGMYSKHGLDMIHRILSKNPDEPDTLPQWMLCLIISKMDLDMDLSATLFFRFEKMKSVSELNERMITWKEYAECVINHKGINAVIDAQITKVFGRNASDIPLEFEADTEKVRFITSAVCDLRGFAGIECIFINEKPFTDKLSKHQEYAEIENAIIMDIVTVAIHEYSHFRVRKVFDDYNFSTPKYAIWSEQDQQCEFGRIVERRFFRVAVDWLQTGKNSPAVQEFIKKFIAAVHSNTDLPSLPDNVNLSERPDGITMSGADFTITPLEMV